MGQIEPKRIVVIGAGSYGPVIAELASACGYSIMQYLDDSEERIGTSVGGVPVAGPISRALESLDTNVHVAVAIGNNEVRLRWIAVSRARGFMTPSLISPDAWLSPSAVVRDPVYMHPGSHVWTEAALGGGTILSPHATVAHHTVLGDGCFVSTAANVGASITVEDQVMFGMGSTTSTGVRTVGHGALIGAGAVVIRDPEPLGVYVGSPARLLRVQPGGLVPPDSQGGAR